MSNFCINHGCDFEGNHEGLHRNRDYVLMVSAGSISAFGSKLSQMALPFLALAMTQAPVWAGLLGAAQLLPYLLFSLPAGVWVDQLNRKRLLVVCDLLRAVLLLSIPIAYVLGQLHLVHVFIVVFIAGLCTLLFEIADLAALPHVVAPRQLGQARSLSEGIEATANVLGPGLGGLIIGLGRSTLSGAMLAYCIDSISYLLSAIALLRVGRPLQDSGANEHGSGGAEYSEIKVIEKPATRKQFNIQPSVCTIWLEGLRFLWQHRTLRMLMLLTSVVNFLQAPIVLFVILTTQGRFGLSPAQIGLLFGLAGLAALLGSFLAGRLYRMERLYAIVRVSLILWALSALIMAIAPNPIMLGLGLVLSQGVWSLYAVSIVSYRLAQTPNHLQGRVISSFRMLSYGAEPVGLALGGFAFSFFSPELLFGGIACGLMGCVVILGCCMRSQPV